MKIIVCNLLLILIITLEIILCTLCVRQLVKLQKVVLAYNDKLIVLNNSIIEANNKIRKILEKINKVTSFLNSKKIDTLRKVFRITFMSIQIIVLLRSLDFSKGLKSINYKNIKKVVYAEIFKKYFPKLIDFLKGFEEFCKNEGK